MEIPAPDGRVLEVLAAPTDGFPFVYHGGSPSAAVPYAPLLEAAERAGLRFVTYSRPGYGASSPRTAAQGTPRMADDVADTTAVLDHLDLDTFVTLGWSGGGPRALACAAMLPGRCLAATSVAGVGPRDADGLAWSTGMAPENVAEYAAADAGPESYAAYLEESFLPAISVGPDEIAAAMGELLTPVDVAALDRPFAGWLAELFARAGAQGVVGVRDDGLAAVSLWGFDPTSISTPTAVWQGDQDAMVPFAHGQWLGQHVPGARVHLERGEGHLSLLLRIDELLAELTGLAGLP